MAPDNEGQGGKEQQQKAIFVANKDPGLEHADHAQNDPANNQAFNPVETVLGNVVAQPFGDDVDEADEQTQDNQEADNKKDCLQVHAFSLPTIAQGIKDNGD